jgi:hypothetical protein
MYKVPLVPSNFMAPTTFGNARFKVEPLSYYNMIQDFAAVDKSADMLGTRLRQNAANYRNYPLQQEVIEVGWHMAEWRRRHSFAYATMSPDGDTCLGGLYVNPTKKRDYDALVLMWTTPDAPQGLDGEVYEALKKWMAQKWPFTKVGYPGREMSFEQWDELPEQPGPRLVDTADKK